MEYRLLPVHSQETLPSYVARLRSQLGKPRDTSGALSLLRLERGRFHDPKDVNRVCLKPDEQLYGFVRRRFLASFRD
jgi:hypothetical protein